MIFWIVVIFVGGLISLVFLDAIREHTLTSALVFSVAFFFVWRTYGFLIGADFDDRLTWEILGTTVTVMAVVGAAGRWWARRSRRGVEPAREAQRGCASGHEGKV